MADNPSYNQGDWFHDESMDRFYQWQYDIDQNVIGWFEICCAPSEKRSHQERRVDPPEFWKIENVFYFTPKPPKKVFVVAENRWVPKED